MSDDITTLRTLRDLQGSLTDLRAGLTVRYSRGRWLAVIAQDGFAIGSTLEVNLLDAIRRALAEAKVNQKILEGEAS